MISCSWFGLFVLCLFYCLVQLRCLVRDSSIPADMPQLNDWINESHPWDSRHICFIRYSPGRGSAKLTWWKFTRKPTWVDRDYKTLDILSTYCDMSEQINQSDIMLLFYTCICPFGRWYSNNLMYSKLLLILQALFFMHISPLISHVRMLGTLH